MVKYIQNYALHQQIGAGEFGRVFRAINNADKAEYAIKVIPVSKFKDNKKLEECTVNEITILTNIESNPHIIRYCDMLKTANNFYFVYEYCNGGTLHNLLQKQGHISEEMAVSILQQLLTAFEVLNKYNILHRDLKPDNIFFHDGKVKLGDFGFCKNLSSGDSVTRTMLGSPIYMAPEVLRGQVYSNKSDIWSLGVVLFEMIEGSCPFQSSSIAQLIEVLSTTEISFMTAVSPYFRSLITRMLTKDPFKRISWIELFQVKNVDPKSLDKDTTAQPIGLYAAKMLSVTNSSVASNSSGYSQLGFKKKPASAKPAENIMPVAENTFYSKVEEKAPLEAVPTTMGFQAQPSTLTVSPHGLLNEHLDILEGVRLARQLPDLKFPHSLALTYLLLQRAEELFDAYRNKLHSQNLQDLIASERKEVQSYKQGIKNRMFSYELKGIEDWKEYLRQKYVEDDRTAPFMLSLVCYLDSKTTADKMAHPSQWLRRLLRIENKQ